MDRVFAREDVVLVLFIDESTPTLNTALKSVSRDLDLTYGLAEVDVIGNLIKKYLFNENTDLGRLMCNIHCVKQCENFIVFLSLRIYVKLILGITEVQNLPF